MVLLTVVKDSFLDGINFSLGSSWHSFTQKWFSLELELLQQAGLLRGRNASALQPPVVLLPSWVCLGSSTLAAISVRTTSVLHPRTRQLGGRCAHQWLP